MAASAVIICPGEAALLATAEALLARLRGLGLTVVTAESCTGGLIAALLTAIPGSSDVVGGGFVTYSNALKSRSLGVPPEVIEREGAVSERVALAMAAGALARSNADVAVSVTGVAGPGGGSADKPVGLVWLAAHRHGRLPIVARHVFTGDRQQIRAAAAATAFAMLGAATDDQV